MPMHTDMSKRSPSFLNFLCANSSVKYKFFYMDKAILST